MPILVSVDDLAALSKMKVAFISHGVEANMPHLAKVASANHVLTISNNMACVDQGYCVVGVESKPKVLIVVNRSATQQSNLQFGAAFLMMVKER